MATKKQKHGLRTWVELDKKAIKHNYDLFRSALTPNCRLMSVVKSNAYGHGLVDFSQAVARCGVDWFGVDSLVEGAALRAAGITQPILILGHTLPERLPEAIELNMSVTIADFDSLKKAIKQAKKYNDTLRVHIKIDTGMGRQGFLLSDLSEVIHLLTKKNTPIVVEGLYTHFAAAKNPAFPAQTHRQIKQFTTWIEAFAQVGIQPITHASATSGTLLYPEGHFDMVRVGIGMYGLWPAPEVKAARHTDFPLKPVLSWKTLVGSIKELPVGSQIGYDLTETCTKKTTTAVLPIGYWHGYARSLSGVGSVLIDGIPARVLGRVSMDMIVVDITRHENVRTGDEVVLLGQQGDACILTDNIAQLCDTINYEIVTGINPLIKRIS